MWFVITIMLSFNHTDGTLLREYKKWATSFPNCLEIGIATSVDINVDRTSKLLNKLGFNTIGTVHRLAHD